MSDTQSLANWMTAFTEGFSDVSERSLGNVRYRTVRPLTPEMFALVYEDWENHVSARAFRLADLEKFPGTPREVARSIIVSELIEPTTHGRVLKEDLVEDLNAEFPGLEWIGNPPQ